MNIDTLPRPPEHIVRHVHTVAKAHRLTQKAHREALLYVAALTDSNGVAVLTPDLRDLIARASLLRPNGLKQALGACTDLGFLERLDTDCYRVTSNFYASLVKAHERSGGNVDGALRRRW